MKFPKIKTGLPFGKKKKTKKIVGLDIGSFDIKLVVLQQDEKGDLSLIKVHKRNLSHGAIVDKDIRDREGLIYAMQSLVDEVDPDITEIAFSLSGHKILVDRVEIAVPKGKGKPEAMVREAIMVEAEQRIPTGIESVQLDYVELGKSEDGKHIQAMLFAARKEIVEDYVGVIMDAGLVPILIDLDAIAVFNAYEFNHDIHEEGCLALINIGHSQSNVAFITNGKLFSIRDISNAARSVWDRLQTELHLSTDDLKELRTGAAPLEQSPTTRRAVYNSSEDLGIGLGMSFSYLENVSGGLKVESVYLSGGGIAIPFLIDSLANRLAVPCELIDPLARIRFDPSIFGDVSVEIAKGVYTAAIGLALRARELI